MTSTLFSQAFARKWKALFVSAALSVTLLSTGCAGPSHTEDGLVGGALIGGFLGTIFGLACHRPLEGAAIGAGIGAGVGGVEGAAADHAEHKQAVAVQQAIAQQQSTWPKLQDIAQMTANGTPDQIIINQIRTTGAIYQLDTDALTYLQQNHVSVAVITEMQATATRPQPGVVMQPAPVYVDPYGPPVVGVRVGGWGWRHY